MPINSSNSKITTNQSHICKLINEHKAHITIVSESNHNDASLNEVVVKKKIFEGFNIEDKFTGNYRVSWLSIIVGNKCIYKRRTDLEIDNCNWNPNNN